MADVAGADKFFSETTRMGDWNKHHKPHKEVSIKEAANMISRLSLYPTPSQRYIDGAIYEQAYHLLNQNEEQKQRQAAILSGVRSRSIGNVSESYASAAESLEAQDGLCMLARFWLRDFLGNARVRTGRIR